MVKCWSNPWRAPVPWRRRSNPIGLCQAGSNEPHWRWVLSSDSNDGCEGPQPSRRALWINVGGIPGGRQSLGAVEAIRLGLCQAGSNEPHWRWVLSSDSNDGCEGPQPSRRAMDQCWRDPWRAPVPWRRRSYPTWTLSGRFK